MLAGQPAATTTAAQGAHAPAPPPRPPRPPLLLPAPDPGCGHSPAHRGWVKLLAPPTLSPPPPPSPHPLRLASLCVRAGVGWLCRHQPLRWWRQTREVGRTRGREAGAPLGVRTGVRKERGGGGLWRRREVCRREGGRGVGVERGGKAQVGGGGVRKPDGMGQEPDAGLAGAKRGGETGGGRRDSGRGVRCVPGRRLRVVGGGGAAATSGATAPRLGGPITHPRALQLARELGGGPN